MRSDRAELIRRSMLTLAGAVVLIGVFGPWLRSGTSTRSSFELLDLVERLGFSSGGAFDWAVRGWPLVPLLVVTAIVAGWAGQARVSVPTGFIAGLYVTGVAFGVRNAPDAGLVRTGWAVDVSLVGGLGLLLVSVWVASSARPVVPESVVPETAFGEDVAK